MSLFYLKSLKPTRTEHWIAISISLYLVSKLIMFYLPSAVGRLFLYPSCLMYLIILIKRWKRNPLIGISRILYSIILIWTLILTIRLFLFENISPFLTGTTHGFMSVISFLFSAPHLFPHLLPLCICCFQKDYDFDISYFIRLSCFLSIFFLLCSPAAFVTLRETNISQTGITEDMDILSVMRSLSPAVIFIFFRKYFVKREWLLLFSVYILGFVLTAYMGRRGGTAMTIFYLFMFWYIYSINANGSKKIKSLLIGMLLLLLSILVVEYTKDSFFSYIFERGMEDNRSDRNEDLIADLCNERDWIFGRGWLGTYYDSVYGYRPYIETGVLQLILRGGLLYCIPYIFLLFFSFINGFFRSKNYLCKSFGSVALVQLVSLYPYGVPAFSMVYFMMWIGIMICNNPTIRQYDDNQIQEYYFYDR